MRPAERVVSALLDGLANGNVPVKIQQADGRVVDGLFNGYWEFPGREAMMSVAYKQPEGWSHGMLHPGDRILTPIPSPEEWKASQSAAKSGEAASTPSKATFWASSGSGAY